MASTLSIVWARLVHDLGRYEHEFTLEEVLHQRPFSTAGETPEEEEERLHTEIGSIERGSDVAEAE